MRKVTALAIQATANQRFQSTPSLRKVTGTSWYRTSDCRRFQSTPSLRKVTHLAELDSYSWKISIHTLLAEGDIYQALLYVDRAGFQSTPSLRKVTRSPRCNNRICPISIHTFLAEGDVAGSTNSTSFPISIHTFLAEGDVKSYAGAFG